jgi:hypothetical protein
MDSNDFPAEDRVHPIPVEPVATDAWVNVLIGILLGGAYSSAMTVANLATAICARATVVDRPHGRWSPVLALMTAQDRDRVTAGVVVAISRGPFEATGERPNRYRVADADRRVLADTAGTTLVRVREEDGHLREIVFDFNRAADGGDLGGLEEGPVVEANYAELEARVVAQQAPSALDRLVGDVSDRLFGEVVASPGPRLSALVAAIEGVMAGEGPMVAAGLHSLLVANGQVTPSEEPTLFRQALEQMVMAGRLEVVGPSDGYQSMATAYRLVVGTEEARSDLAVLREFGAQLGPGTGGGPVPPLLVDVQGIPEGLGRVLAVLRLRDSGEGLTAEAIRGLAVDEAPTPLVVMEALTYGVGAGSVLQLATSPPTYRAVTEMDRAVHRVVAERGSEGATPELVQTRLRDHGVSTSQYHARNLLNGLLGVGAMALERRDNTGAEAGSVVHTYHAVVTGPPPGTPGEAMVAEVQGEAPLAVLVEAVGTVIEREPRMTTAEVVDRLASGGFLAVSGVDRDQFETMVTQAIHLNQNVVGWPDDGGPIRWRPRQSEGLTAEQLGEGMDRAEERGLLPHQGSGVELEGAIIEVLTGRGTLTAADIHTALVTSGRWDSLQREPTRLRDALDRMVADDNSRLWQLMNAGSEPQGWLMRRYELPDTATQNMMAVAREALVRELRGEAEPNLLVDIAEMSLMAEVESREWLTANQVADIMVERGDEIGRLVRDHALDRATIVPALEAAMLANDRLERINPEQQGEGHRWRVVVNPSDAAEIDEQYEGLVDTVVVEDAMETNMPPEGRMTQSQVVMAVREDVEEPTLPSGVVLAFLNEAADAENSRVVRFTDVRNGAITYGIADPGLIESGGIPHWVIEHILQGAGPAEEMSAEGVRAALVREGFLDDGEDTLGVAQEALDAACLMDGAVATTT